MIDTVWMDASDVCIMLKITKQCVHNWRNAGLLPHSKMGGKYFYKKNDIEKILNNNYKKCLF